MLSNLLLLCALLACIASADVSRACLQGYTSSRGGIEVCGTIDEAIVLDVARNCTDGDVPRAYATLAAFCSPIDLNDQSDHQDQQTPLSPSSSRTSRSSGQRSSSSSSSSTKASLSQLASGKRPSLRDFGSRSFSAISNKVCAACVTLSAKTSAATAGNSIFQEGSVIFAISGLMFTTLTSFIFL